MEAATVFKRATFYLWVGLVYWVLMLMGDMSEGGGSFGLRVINEVWRGIYIIALNFLFFEYIVPRLTTKRILRSILLVLGSLFLYVFGLFIWHCIGIGAHIYTTFPTDGTMKAQFGDQFGAGFASFFFFGIIKHVYDHVKLRKTAQQLRIEKQAAELNYLKSQTNPHFLFNTLNNIYSLARDKSDLAPESVLRLSKILRFMLYETGGEFIAIEQELKIIGDYIALEQLRYDDTLRVSFNYDIEDMKQAIPPLLLIPLVENAFKHGASETRNQPFVDIHLSVNQRRLTFVVKNSTEESPVERTVKENIGLSNLRRQLELLYTDFGLAVQQAGKVFTACLKINLSSHV